jgi:hypothetical protein
MDPLVSTIMVRSVVVIDVDSACMDSDTKGLVLDHDVDSAEIVTVE